MSGNIWIKSFHRLYSIWKREILIGNRLRKREKERIERYFLLSITPRSSQVNIDGITTPEQIELIERRTSMGTDNPAILAEIVLRDLFCRAHLNNITYCVQPILT